MPQEDSPVEISWEDGHPWVRLRNSWRDSISAGELANTLVDLYQSHVWPPEPDEGEPVPRRPLTYNERLRLRRVRHAYVQAQTRSVENLMSSPPPLETTTVRGAIAKWKAGRLMTIGFEPDWIMSVGVQNLCESLSELLSDPPSPPSEDDELVATRRALENFWSHA